LHFFNLGLPNFQDVVKTQASTHKPDKTVPETVARRKARSLLLAPSLSLGNRGGSRQEEGKSVRSGWPPRSECRYGGCGRYLAGHSARGSGKGPCSPLRAPFAGLARAVVFLGLFPQGEG
jgi:hypothetical protein